VSINRKRKGKPRNDISNI